MNFELANFEPRNYIIWQVHKDSYNDFAGGLIDLKPLP